jgi:hypothetical protein
MKVVTLLGSNIKLENADKKRNIKLEREDKWDSSFSFTFL